MCYVFAGTMPVMSSSNSAKPWPFDICLMQWYSAEHFLGGDVDSAHHAYHVGHLCFEFLTKSFFHGVGSGTFLCTHKYKRRKIKVAPRHVPADLPTFHTVVSFAVVCEASSNSMDCIDRLFFCFPSEGKSICLGLLIKNWGLMLRILR